MRLRAPAAFASVVFGVGGLVIAACEPITGTPPLRAPTNSCIEHPCDAYAPGKTSASCNERGQCEIQERPSFDFTMVVHVPDSSYYAAGQVFAITSASLFDTSQTNRTAACPAPSCVQLPRMQNLVGSYSVTTDAAAQCNLRIAATTSFPTRVVFVPLVGSSNDVATTRGLPLGPLFGSSRVVTNEQSSSVQYVQALPNGAYRRYVYPEPPYDEWLPPAIAASVIPAIVDDILLSTTPLPTAAPPTIAPLDDPELRRAGVRRAEGLDGWTIWLADGSTGQRISTLRKLKGRSDQVTLQTTGQRQEGGGIPENVDVIVAPPEGALALPRLQSRLFSGAGLGSLEYPALPAPVSVSGVVAVATSQGLGGIPSKLSFASTQIRAADDTLQQILVYETTLSTDALGSFTTVIPSGVYDVTVEPAEGTGFSKVTSSVVVDGRRGLTLEPPKRTLARGRAILSDGRPLALADVLVSPSVGLANPPRASRTRTAQDGTFVLELDRGQYDVSVEPQGGTGFPRLVTIRAVDGDDLDLGTLTVPAPTRLSLTLKDPNATNNPIVRAVVRFFAEPELGGPAVEIGSTMTDQDGNFEILLAQQPR